jgi:hypothetical protein
VLEYKTEDYTFEKISHFLFGINATVDPSFDRKTAIRESHIITKPEIHKDNGILIKSLLAFLVPTKTTCKDSQDLIKKDLNRIQYGESPGVNHSEFFKKCLSVDNIFEYTQGNFNLGPLGTLIHLFLLQSITMIGQDSHDYEIMKLCKTIYENNSLCLLPSNDPRNKTISFNSYYSAFCNILNTDMYFYCGGAHSYSYSTRNTDTFLKGDNTFFFSYPFLDVYFRELNRVFTNEQIRRIPFVMALNTAGCQLSHINRYNNPIDLIRYFIDSQDKDSNLNRLGDLIYAISIQLAKKKIPFSQVNHMLKDLHSKFNGNRKLFREIVAKYSNLNGYDLSVKNSYGGINIEDLKQSSNYSTRDSFLSDEDSFHTPKSSFSWHSRTK